MSQTREILKQVKKLEITTKLLADGLVTGNSNSIFKGQGIEFSEIRDYRPGDDIRAIDWKVTARFNHPYIKEFIEERDLQIYFVIDLSESGSFGTNISKKQKALEIIASLMFAALRNNDRMGVFLITDRVEKFIPAKKGRKHLLQVLNLIVSFTPKSQKTDLKTSLVQISKIIKRKSIIFVISDFIDESEFLKPLKILRKKHDIIALKISDLREKEIPDVGLIELEDKETGEQILVDTSDEDFRNSYSKLISENELQFTSNLRKIKIDTLQLFTDQNYSIPLRNFFRRRK
ncbi:MAG: DUF58 domain-containing protein [Nitrosopumilus sp.]|jgi:uncharacterized protein (DUF58 family)|nr:DUF58 domain-containing protein [Nitrosopumilus sp.]